jgi:hypothetical protein
MKQQMDHDQKFKNGIDTILQAIQNQEHKNILMQQQTDRLGPMNFD